MHEHELQDPANWKMEEAQSHEPVKNARAIVSVGFDRDDLAFVSKAAGESGMKTSEFIRHAAIAAASRSHRRRFDALSAGATQGVSVSLLTNWRRGGTGRLVLRRVTRSQSSRDSINQPGEPPAHEPVRG